MAGQSLSRAARWSAALKLSSSFSRELPINERAGVARERQERRSNRPQPALILFLALFTSQAGFLVLTPILPDVARDLGVSTATAGGLRIASGLAGGVVAFTLAVVGRRLGLRDLIAVGLLMIVLGSATGAAAPTFAVLAASQLAFGAGNAIVLSGAVAAAARWSGPSERARVLSWALLGQPASWIAGMPIIGALAGSSWRLAMCVPLAASAIALAVLATRSADPPDAARGGILSLLGRDSAVAGWAVGELLAYAAWGGTLTFAGALMIESYGPSPGLVGLLLAAAAAAYFPGNLLARRRAGESPRQLLALLGSGLALTLAVFGAVRPGLWFSVALFALIVLLAGGRTLSGSAAGLEAAPRNEVAVMSIRAAATQLGMVVGAALGGAALTLGGYALLGAVLSILFAAGAVPHLAALRIPAITHPCGPVPATEGC
jgi:predicted MFS family arabinose efflux permease